MANQYGPRIVTDGLVLHLDAGNTKSYPGTGTIWNDLSGNNYHFNINASAYSKAGGIHHMNFEGSYGVAKRVVSGSLVDVPAYSNSTIMVFTTIMSDNNNYRTLIRGAVDDHQVLIETGGDTLGMYDNDSDVFIPVENYFQVTSIPNYSTVFNCLTFKLSSFTPYYDFRYNANSSYDDMSAGLNQITDNYPDASTNNGFAVIGGYHTFSTDVGDGDQYWGKISIFLYYNRHLTDSEIKQNYNALKGRFSL
jgi:hypothetical protein